MASKIQYAVVTLGEDGQPIRTWFVDPRITLAKRFIRNRRFICDPSDFRIMKGTSALDWVEVPQ